jgi:hypothetical protein
MQTWEQYWRRSQASQFWRGLEITEECASDAAFRLASTIFAKPLAPLLGAISLFDMVRWSAPHSLADHRLPSANSSSWSYQGSTEGCQNVWIYATAAPGGLPLVSGSSFARKNIEAQAEPAIVVPAAARRSDETPAPRSQTASDSGKWQGRSPVCAARMPVTDFPVDLGPTPSTPYQRCRLLFGKPAGHRSVPRPKLAGENKYPWRRPGNDRNNLRSTAAAVAGPSGKPLHPQSEILLF